MSFDRKTRRARRAELMIELECYQTVLKQDNKDERTLKLGGVPDIPPMTKSQIVSVYTMLLETIAKIQDIDRVDGLMTMIGFSDTQ